MDWAALAAKLLHPTQVAIIEAMLYLEKPVSPQNLARSFDVSLPNVAYHMRALAKIGVVEKVGQRPVRGAMENFYGLVSS